MKVMIVVTHLLGTGHLRRATALARAFAAASHGVTLVSGGRPVPGLDLTGIRMVQVPPVQSDGVRFSVLLDDTGTPVTQARMTERRDRIVACLNDTRPDVLITELFPFGRRVLRDEFTALLEAAHALPAPPVILSSVRDILAPPSTPEKAQRSEEILTRLYDAVLVHSDPAAVPLDTSWPVTDRLAAMLRYTGFVAPPASGPHPDAAGAGEVLVSAGGGAVGQSLFTAASDAARMDSRTWRVLVGGGDTQARCAEMRRLAPPNVIFEPVRPDFRQMLHHAACSVSLCGYNTALDLLMAGTPAVFVPFDEGGEQEQSLRAASLSRMPGFAAIRASDLSPQALLDAVRSVIAAPRAPALKDAFQGAARTVQICTALCQDRA